MCVPRDWEFEQERKWAARGSHCACTLNSLEKCNLSAAVSQDLALYFTSTQRTARLCLGFNPLQDEGARLLCASLTHPECALERLV